MKTIYLLIGLYILLPFSMCATPFHWKKVHPAFDSLSLQLENGFIEDMPKTERLQLLDKMYELSRLHKELPILRLRTLYWDARMKPSTDSVFILLKESMAAADFKKYDYDLHHIQHLWTKVMLDKGEWLQAYIQAKKGEKYFQGIGDTLMLGYTWVHLGVIMSNLKDLSQALNYLEKADTCFSKVKRTHLQIKNQLNICNLLFCMQNTEKAMRVFNSLLEKDEIRCDTSFYINVLSLGCYDPDANKVQTYTHKAYELARASGNRLLIAKTSINKASSLYAYHYVDSAQLLYRQAMHFATATRNYGILLPALEGITNTYSAKSRWDSAFYYSMLYRHYNDSISKINSLSEINRIESRATIERYESDLIQMEMKAQLQRKTHIWIVTAIFSISLLVCLGFWYMRKKETMKKQLKEAEVKELNVSLENEILKNERYHLEIDSKNRELTSNIMLMQEKNEVLRNLLQQIDALGSEGELSRKKSSELKKQIKNHLQTDDEWEYFKLHFESVYPEFFVNLKKVYPTLTENDLRLCAYIRIGMSNKQIAQMLSVLPDSIKISRYRIRKKFLLQQKDSLEDFLREI